jgi:PAS domain S-box-containing protein
MASATWFPHQRLYKGIRRLRERPLLTYGVAFVLVILALVARLIIGPLLPPFVTFYPAILLSALLGGTAVGAAAVAASALVAWIFILPFYDGWTLAFENGTLTFDAAFVLTVFVVFCAVLLSISAFLDRLLRGMSEQEKTLSILVDGAPNGLLVFDRKGTIELVNQSAERLFGYASDELIGKPVDVLLAPGTTRPGHLISPELRSMGMGHELGLRRKDGSEIPVEIALSPVASRSGEATLATLIDISARKRLQASQQLLISELRRHTRNMLGEVTAIAMNTFSVRRSMAEARSVFSDRMEALQSAHELIESKNWEGVTLAEILERQFAGMRDRVVIKGCDIPIRVSAAQQFALIVNELATNAMKHGALSQDEGRVSIRGTVYASEGRPSFCFEWEESGGPVVAPPASIGFGTLMVEDAARRFARDVKAEFAARGLRYELRVDLDDIGAEAPGNPA